jgi:urease accessory protein
MRAGIIITMMTTMTTTTDLVRLLTWLSPGFPTGGYAYSHGLEWAVETGDVRDVATLVSWCGDLLRHGSGWSDAILLRHAHRARNDDALQVVMEAAAAACSGRERRMETIAQGEAFVAAALVWTRDLPASGIAYPVAVGAMAARHDIDEDAAAAGFLHALTANWVSAAVRLVPLGQVAGLTALAALEPIVLEIAQATRAASLDDIGGACFRAEIAAMRHETQETRLFRT